MKARCGIDSPGLLLEPMVERDDVQHVEVLALVLVDALDLDVEHPVRVQLDTGHRVDVLGQARFVGALDVAPLLPEGGIVDELLQPAQPLQIGQPAVTDGAVQQLAQPGVGQRQEPAWRHAVGLVAEPLRPELVEVLEHTGFQQVRVQRGDTVDGVAADRGQVRHPNVLAAVLADQRHPADALLVAGEPGAHLVEEPPVDLVDDLEVAGQRLGEHLQRPLLQRLGQQGVVGVAERRHGDVPGLVPAQVPLVDQQPHQLGDPDRRMGVVELQRESLGELLDGQSARSSMMCSTCCSEQDTKKYCCSRRRRLPASGSSLG